MFLPPNTQLRTGILRHSLSVPFSCLQLQDEIQQLRQQLQEKEEELAEVKRQLGITAFTEFKQSMAHGLKVVEQKLKGVQETET